jgi:hypothetical protein
MVAVVRSPETIAATLRCILRAWADRRLRLVKVRLQPMRGGIDLSRDTKKTQKGTRC